MVDLKIDQRQKALETALKLVVSQFLQAKQTLGSGANSLAAMGVFGLQ